MKKFLIITAVIFGVVIIGIAAYLFYLFQSTASTAEEMHDPIGRTSELREGEPDLSNGDPFSMLLLGIDSEESTSGRSDTMIVMTVNPELESIKMVSIPRDSLVNIEGRGQDKINHAYAFGGAELAMDTVENFIDVPIDYYATVNMESFIDTVDMVNGVTVNNGLSFEYGGYTFPEGEIELSGEEALAFVRMRKEDPQGDAGRNERQRQVIDAVINEGAQISNITKIDDFLEILGDNAKTSFTFEEMRQVQSNYRAARHNLEETQMRGEDATIDGIYYMEIPDQTIQGISTELNEHLQVQ
ncbi:LytR family transcriptional attenuator [Sinobaca qinghaiensis]|uniref:LytR family transcriptional attenuator n=1 Tax=Sinobaca qinghaiensis TaxID=342944 RepID=A0A419V900_9BACL|nr:LCP family protein [Sinobaca qinghaiensis]RKD76443.1 LytR family transcriptional attenuator [Sinobaca qinghaiensis]